ncbi:hypothetical protein I5P86_11520 [Pseudomonas glycinae]|uniref:hypothetical protein n=1 Tax=Pseudomonas glycinae TaxID=1785145 RepID=UPI0018D6C9BD|nr:hypothetical protein [Pseudomonas glycinae]MBH3405680.1 hypothetical protein [Pseudomonas glycinae]
MGKNIHSRNPTTGVLPTEHKSNNLQLVASPSPESRALITVYPNSKQQGAPVDPIHIEDTDDWLGCPTPLETCRQQLRLYENEFEELNRQLREERERIFKLVEMHAAVATERDQLRTQMAAAKSEAADAKRRATDIETKSNWELIGERQADQRADYTNQDSEG